MSMLRLACQVLGVGIGASEMEVRYAYYRMMCQHHPDKNPADSEAHRRSALINEAKDLVLGRSASVGLLKDRELVAGLLNASVSDEAVLSYEEWLKERFFDCRSGSIWP